MEYRELTPSPALAPFVRCYWSLRDTEPRADRPLERVVPDGRMELIVHLGDPFARLDAEGRPTTQRPLVLAGQLEAAVLLRPAQRVDVFAVRFQPWGAGALLDVAPRDLTDRLLALDEVLGGDARALEGRLRACTSLAARREAAEGWLLARLGRARRVPPVVEQAVRWGQRHGGRVGAAELAEAVGAGPRRLERGFLAHVGIAPKVFLRITRLQGVLQRLKGELPASWARLALEQGFCDQAHLTREFSDLAGTSPSRFLAESHGLNDAILDPC